MKLLPTLMQLGGARRAMVAPHVKCVLALVNRTVVVARKGMWEACEREIKPRDNHCLPKGVSTRYDACVVCVCVFLHCV